MTRFTDVYDADIKRASALRLPMLDWRWLKAQLYQESKLDPKARNARSSAMGMGQFMPPTWGDVCKALGFSKDADPYDAALSIQAAAFYMRQLWNVWSMPRPVEDRLRLAQASYNAGTRHILDAQKLAMGAMDSASILARLHEVTGDANAAETHGYVKNIERWYREMAGRPEAPDFSNVVAGVESTAPKVSE